VGGEATHRSSVAFSRRDYLWDGALYAFAPIFSHHSEGNPWPGAELLRRRLLHANDLARTGEGVAYMATCAERSRQCEPARRRREWSGHRDRPQAADQHGANHGVRPIAAGRATQGTCSRHDDLRAGKSGRVGNVRKRWHARALSEAQTVTRSTRAAVSIDASMAVTPCSRSRVPSLAAAGRLA
jgi:hypothetical protein